MTHLQEELFKLQDIAYRDFHSSLMPGVDKEAVIGVRTPVLRAFAKKFSKTEEAGQFMGVMMRMFLDEDFKEEYIQLVAGVKSEEYYVNMMIAWYMATALAKQWDAAIPYIQEHRLSEWVHRKSIQKAVESYRITPEQKDYLKGLR